MPRLFTFYVVSPRHLDQGDVDAAVAQHGARWAQFEGKAIGALEAFDTIDGLLDAPVLRHRLGAFSPGETVAIRDALSGASSAAMGRIATDADLDRIFWALRDTAEEAARRNACLVIACEG